MLAASPRKIAIRRLNGRRVGVLSGREDQPTVLFLHGPMSRLEHFENYMRAFSEDGLNCCALSFRGRGGIPPEGAAGVHLADYLEDALAVRQAIDGEVIVCGHSLGALIALKLAELSAVSAAILLAPAPAGHMRLPPLSAIPVLFDATACVITGKPRLLSYAALAHVAMPLLPEDERRKIYSEFVPESGFVLRAMALGVSIDKRRVRCPVLCISGERDGLCTPRLVASLARRLKAAWTCFSDQDHWFLTGPRWEEPARYCLDWLHARSAALPVAPAPLRTGPDMIVSEPGG